MAAPWSRSNRCTTKAGVLGGLLIVAITACSGDDSDPSPTADREPVERSTEGTGVEEGASTTTAEGGNESEDQGRVDEPSEPLATVESEGDSPWVTLEVTDLRRTSEETVTLEFVVATTDDESIDLGFTDAFTSPYATEEDQNALYGAVSGVTLVDQANRKRHLVLRDADRNFLCTAFPGISPEYGTRYEHSAQFPAPPADVEEMTVEVPQFPSVDQVPLREG